MLCPCHPDIAAYGASGVTRRAPTLRRRLLQRNDWFTQSHASKLLARILHARPEKGSAPLPPASAVSAAEEGVQATQVQSARHRGRAPSRSRLRAG